MPTTDPDLTALRNHAAQAVGLPDSLLPFLTGTTPEDLAGQATTLAAHAKAPGALVPTRPRPFASGAAVDRAPVSGHGTPTPVAFDPSRLADSVRALRDIRGY